MKKPSALFTLLSITLLASLHFGLAQDVTYVQVPAGSVQANQQPQVVYVQQVPAATPPPQQTVVYQQVPAQTQPTVVQTVQQPTQQPNVVYVQQAPAPVQQQPQVVQQVQPQVVQQVQPQVVQQVQQTAPVTQQTQAAPQTTVVYQEVPVQTQPTVVAAPQQAQVVTQQPAATTTTQQVQQAQPAQVVVQQAPTTQPVQQAPVTSTPAPAPETVQAAAPTPAPTTTAPAQPAAPVQQAQPTTPPPTTEKKGGSLAESTYDTYYRPMESGADIDPNNINQKSSGLIDAKMSYIDAPLMDIVWCGEKKNVIFMLTEKSTLYRSEDDGFTGHVLTSHLHKLGKAELGSDPGEVGEVSRIIQSPVDKSLLIVMGTHGINWVTENCGSSFRAMNQGRHVDEFHFHPTEKNWVLASAWTICDDFVGEPCRNYKELFVSKDLGLNWDILHHYVYQFAWARLDHSFTDIPLDRVILSHDPNAKGNQTESGWKSHLMVSYIDNLDKKPVPFAMGGNKFLLSKNFLFVVMATDQSEKEVTLLVGSPKDKFYTLRPIEIPTKRISEHGYTVLDASEHSVFLHIDHGIDQGNHGTLYVSDSTGVRYSLALKNNVRDFSGQCDFEKVQGLEGIYLSNIYDAGALKRFQNIEAERASDFPVQHGGTKKTSADAFQHPDHYSADFQVNMRNNRADNAQKTLQDFKKTMISFDKGAMWQQLIPPERDSQGKKIVCRSEEECGLHLHSLSSRGFGPFYTTANSLGVILGTGNVGEFLSNHPDEVNTYLSRDGGLNWFEVAKGSHIYEIGDHGGLIVMAPDHNATRDVYYSWNEGITWERVRISEDYIHVTNIIIEPSNTAEKFMIYGKEVNGQRGFVAAVDFTSLHQRTCVFPTRPDTPESDYETWTPNGRISPHCLLGRQVSYVRRKRDAKCFNTEEHDEWKSTVPCQCTEEDWECDFGYMRQGTGACLPISDELTKYALVVPETCNSYYYMTQGYRKISGDSCQGGVSHEPIKLPCPGTGLLSAKNLSMFLMVGAILLVFVWLNKPQNMDMVKGVFEVYKEKVRARFSRKPANQGYTQHIPGKYADEEDNFSNVLFDDNEEEAEEIAGPAEDGVDLISDSQSKKMTERKAMDAARKHVPLLNKPSDKKMESLKGGI